jgi:tetratricopeptide (TPR) repeat protein
MDRALREKPQYLWAHFYQGSCACRQRRYDEAVVAFSVCVALAPESAWCRHNRGLAYAELGQLDRAARDYDDALRLDPTLAAAALGRAALRQRQKLYADALADLERARELGVAGAEIDYRRALVYLERQDRAAARASLRAALRQGPEHAPARELLARLEQGP